MGRYIDNNGHDILSKNAEIVSVSCKLSGTVERTIKLSINQNLHADKTTSFKIK